MNKEKDFQQLRYIENTIRFKKMKFKKILHYVSGEPENLLTIFFFNYNSIRGSSKVSRFIKN